MPAPPGSYSGLGGGSSVRGFGRRGPLDGYPMERLRALAEPRVAVEAPFLSDAVPGWRCLGATSLTAAVGELPHVQLFNPAGSGQRVVIETILARSPTGGRINLRRATVALGTLAGRWRRTQPTQQPAFGELRTGDDPAEAGDLLFTGGIVAGDTVRFSDLALALDAGAGINVIHDTTATLLMVSFLGREYDETTFGAA